MEHAGGGWQYPDTENAARQFGEGRPDVLGGREWGSGKSALIQRTVASLDSEPGAKRVSANRQVWTPSSRIAISRNPS